MNELGNETGDYALNADGNYEATIIDNAVLVSQGGTPNLQVQSRIHVTITPDGRFVNFTYDPVDN